MIGPIAQGVLLMSIIYCYSKSMLALINEFYRDEFKKSVMKDIPENYPNEVRIKEDIYPLVENKDIKVPASIVSEGISDVLKNAITSDGVLTRCDSLSKHSLDDQTNDASVLCKNDKNKKFPNPSSSDKCATQQIIQNIKPYEGLEKCDENVNYANYSSIAILKNDIYKKRMEFFGLLPENSLRELPTSLSCRKQDENVILNQSKTDKYNYKKVINENCFPSESEKATKQTNLLVKSNYEVLDQKISSHKSNERIIYNEDELNQNQHHLITEKLSQSKDTQSNNFPTLVQNENIENGNYYLPSEKCLKERANHINEMKNKINGNSKCDITVAQNTRYKIQSQLNRLPMELESGKILNKKNYLEDDFKSISSTSSSASSRSNLSFNSKELNCNRKNINEYIEF